MIYKYPNWYNKLSIISKITSYTVEAYFVYNFPIISFTVLTLPSIINLFNNYSSIF